MSGPPWLLGGDRARQSERPPGPGTVALRSLERTSSAGLSEPLVGSPGQTLATESWAGELGQGVPLEPRGGPGPSPPSPIASLTLKDAVLPARHRVRPAGLTHWRELCDRQVLALRRDEKPAVHSVNGDGSAKPPSFGGTPRPLRKSQRAWLSRQLPPRDRSQVADSRHRQAGRCMGRREGGRGTGRRTGLDGKAQRGGGGEATGTSRRYGHVTAVTVFPRLLRGSGPRQDGHHPLTAVTNGGAPGFLHKPLLLGGTFFPPRTDHQSRRSGCHNAGGSPSLVRGLGHATAPGWARHSDPGPPGTQPSA